MNGMDSLMSLPTSSKIILGVLFVCQIIAMVWAVIRLVRDKRGRIAGLPRPLWLVIIIFGQLLGPVIFLILHTQERRAIAQQNRYQQSQLHEKQNSAHKDASSVISSLYRE